MKLLETFVASPVAAALGWTILHSLWEGAILAALLAAVLLVTCSPRIRYAASLIALVAMAAAFVVTLIRLLPESAAAGVAREAYHAVPWNIPPDAAASSGLLPDLAMLAPWLVPFWMAGVLACYLRNVAGFASVRRLRVRGVCCAPEHWQHVVTRFSARLVLSRPVVLMESALAEVPMVIGAMRPMILMPVGLLTGWPEEQIEAILLHELAHVLRHDYLVNMLQRLLEGLLFYHPAVWWFSRVIRMERENCCDDIAVSIGGDAHEYAVALAALETNRWAGREPAVAAAGGNLLTRIRRLLYPKTSGGSWTPFAAAAILFATTAVALGGWQSTSSAQTTAKSEVTTDRYSKWLNEDVVYIIQDRERAAFQRLATDEERDHFIQQFWEVRNPDPNATENTFKVEHYRRIAFANRHFRTPSGTPGWQTDRGHMYIVWGPPDEIDSHPKGDPNGVPFDLWTYYHSKTAGNNVSFTFIDKSGHGDYQLAPGNAH